MFLRRSFGPACPRKGGPMQTTEEPVKGGLPTARPTGATGIAGETQGTAGRGEDEDTGDEAELFASEEEESEEEGLEASDEDDEEEGSEELSADEETEDDDEDEVILEAEALAAVIQPVDTRESSA